MAAHRYWRARAYSGGLSSGSVCCAELGLKAVHGGTNLSIGATAIASVSGGTGFEPSKANDGSNATFWTSNGAAAPTGGHWIGIDFGASPQDIIDFLYTNRPDGTGQSPNALAIEFSDDAAAWSLALDTGPLTWSSPGQTQTFTTAPINNAQSEQMAILGVEDISGAVPQVSQIVMIAVLEGPPFSLSLGPGFALPCWQPCTAFGTEALVITFR